MCLTSDLTESVSDLWPHRVCLNSDLTECAECVFWPLTSQSIYFDLWYHQMHAVTSTKSLWPDLTECVFRFCQGCAVTSDPTKCVLTSDIAKCVLSPLTSQNVRPDFWRYWLFLISDLTKCCDLTKCVLLNMTSLTVRPLMMPSVSWENIFPLNIKWLLLHQHFPRSE